MPRARLAFVPLAALQAEISRRRRLLPKLIAQRDDLNRQIAAIQGSRAERAAEPDAKARRKTKRRARNKTSLADTLVAFLAGKPKVTVAEAMQGVLAGGYKTKSKGFRGAVNRALLADKRVKRVGRGEFTLKG